jgi:cephalosporin hydroxylase/Flp pilus assembly protein TadD
MIQWHVNTPIAFFIFNRPDTTARVFEAIRQAKPSKLLVVADGPRLNRLGEAEKCAVTRAIIDRVDWECEVLTNYSDVNLGCRHRVSSGLTWVFEQVEEAIILEDDCLPHPSFFRFCETLLERYRDDDRVMHISGDSFHLEQNSTSDSYYVSRYNFIWGWASWRRAWQNYDLAMQKWPQLRDENWLNEIFPNNPSAIRYWSNTFQNAYEGFDTWDFAWTFACWSHQGLSILPRQNLVSNIGFGAEATHTKNASKLSNLPTAEIEFPLRHPSILIRNTQADDLSEINMFSGMIQPNSNLDTDAIIQQAIENLNASQYTEALNLFEQAIIQASHLPGLNYGKAVSLAQLGRFQEAIAALNTLLISVPDHQKGQQLLAQLQSQVQPQPVSSAIAPDRTSSPESSVQALLKQTLDLFNAGEKIEALRTAEKAATFNIFVPELHYIRAICSSAVGRYEEALAAAQQELQFNPTHAQAQAIVENLSQALVKPEKPQIPIDQRPWGTTLPYDLMMSIQNATHNYTYRGVPMLKNPFDFALYPMLLWQIKPRTIIEIGSKSGGSGLWFGDMLDSFGIDGHIYSIDIVKVTSVSHPRLTFMEGDGQGLHKTLTPDFMNALPRPLLIVEDADHSYETSKSVLDFFHPYLHEGEYIVIEDGIISDIVRDASYNSGPHQALKQFFEQHKEDYEVDSQYCDYFGYNVTWCTNGFLRKVTRSVSPPSVEQPPAQSSATARPLASLQDLIEQATLAFQETRYADALNLSSQAKALKQPKQGVDYLRALCFLQLNQLISAVQALYEELRHFPNNIEAQALLDRLIAQSPQLQSRQINDPEFQDLFQLVRPYTMLSEARLYSLFSSVKRICQENIPGNIVECRVAGGGSTALMAAVVQRYSQQPRFLYAFDSFEGMPTPTERDRHNGIHADSTWWGTGTCAAPEESVLQLCSKLGVSQLVKTVKGYFQETLPKMRDRVGMIALLHADGDWYESTHAIFQNLYDRVVNDGLIQVDDYGYWEGCRQALHEFEAQRHLKFEIHPIDETGVWFLKPDKFPLNPSVSPSLLAEFHQDDPVKQGIQSQMSTNERFQLYYVLRTLLKPGSSPFRFVEIGSFAGSSLFLNVRSLKRSHAYLQGFAVDPGGHPQLRQVIEHLRGDVQHLPLFSHQAAPQLQQFFQQDGKFPEFIFVDGDHTYQGVRQDIIDYFPLLAPGGIMVFHDYLPPLNDENREAILFHHAGQEPGIRQACQELMENTYGCEVLELPLLYPTDPTQTQPYLPIIPGVFSSIRAYRKPHSNAR